MFQLIVANDLKREAQRFNLMGKDIQRVNTAFINAHAFNSFQEQKKGLALDIDRPTPFTQQALAFYKARTGRMESGVYAKPIQAEYLARLLGPTTRYAKTKFVFVPASGQQTDAYGNMPKTRRRQALRGKIHTVRRGRARLVFRHAGKRREFLGVFVPTTRYKVKQWKFYERAQRHYDKTWRSTYAKQWDRFMRKYNR